MDETGKELLIKWSEVSKIYDRAKLVINNNNKRLKKEEKINKNIDEINILANDIVKNHTFKAYESNT